jgi:hypothetical protein
MPRQGQSWPEDRTSISAATKARMADPSVRAKISAGCRRAWAARKAAARDVRDDLAALRMVWRAAHPRARLEFLDELRAGGVL